MNFNERIENLRHSFAVQYNNFLHNIGIRSEWNHAQETVIEEIRHHIGPNIANLAQDGINNINDELFPLVDLFQDLHAHLAGDDADQ